MTSVANWPQPLLEGDPQQVFKLYSEQMDAIRLDALSHTDAMWTALIDPSLPAATTVGEFAGYAAELSLGYQTYTWNETQAMLSLYADTLAGEAGNLELVPMPVTGMRVLSAFDVYRWPLARMLAALKANKPDPFGQGMRVFRQLSQTDIQLSMLNSGLRYFHADPRIGSYEREPNVSACKFCREHAHKYSNHQIMPLHPGCKCLIRPVVSKHHLFPSTDPEIVIPPDTTQEIPVAVH